MVRADYFDNPDHLPDYYDTMYLDGFEPWQILEAANSGSRPQNALQTIFGAERTTARRLQYQNQFRNQGEKMRNTSQQEKDKKKKKRESELESYIFSVMEKSIKKALDAALDDLLKDWK